jgi:hypothetical protein
MTYSALLRRTNESRERFSSWLATWRFHVPDTNERMAVSREEAAEGVVVWMMFLIPP